MLISFEVYMPAAQASQWWNCRWHQATLSGDMVWSSLELKYCLIMQEAVQKGNPGTVKKIACKLAS